MIKWLDISLHTDLTKYITDHQEHTTNDTRKAKDEIINHGENNGCTILYVGIQTAALIVTHWISYGYPAGKKRAGYLFQFHLPITIAVI